MASNHVPSDQVPLQGQTLYNDPSYQNLFSSADRFGASSWDSQLHQQNTLPPNATPQAWQHGSFPQQPYTAFSQPYGAQNHGFQTSSPYQYGQFNQQTPVNTYAQPANVDPSLSLDPNALRQHQQSPYQMPLRTPTPQSQTNTITPQALQQSTALAQNTRPTASPFQTSRPTPEQILPRVSATSFVKPTPVPTFEIPKGKRAGGLYVLDQAALAKATNSTPLNKLVTLGSEPFHLATNRTALPLYTPRQSVRELKRVGADNKKLLAKLSSAKPSVAKALKKKTYVGSPSALKKEVSDSESFTESSEDDSEYTDDEDDEISPLPASRPEEPHEAVRYDIIKAAWHPVRSSLSSEKIKDGMREVWEVLNTIQKRWRADSKAVSEAEDKKNIGELPVLKSRVASQRDLLLSALRAALDHAHPDILYHLGQIKAFLYLCYQFLANRYQNKDYDGALPSIIFEVLSRCGFLTSELLEETRLYKALTSMKKHANEKHKAFIQQVIDGAVANSKKAKVSSPPQSDKPEVKGAKRPAPEPANRPSSELPAAKKSKPTEGPTGAVKKVNGPTATSKPTSTIAGVQQKRPGEKPASAPAPTKARVSQVTNKPSGIFASLNAASKKPTPTTPAVTTAGSKATTASKPATAAAKDRKPAATPAKPAFSFAQTMASLLKPKEPEAAPVKSEKQLPPETPEEKAKRLRKEARRHLRVTFKPDAALVQIKYFSHDPEEEMGHDENFVRDAGDIGGEGRMFKQHKELDVDDDDDELEIELQPWQEPSAINFSTIAELTQGNYAPYGGGKQVPSCPEKEANIARENATLMVFYADPNDIPSSPREPLEQEQESAPAVTVKMFGAPSTTVMNPSAQPPSSVPAPDMSVLENIFKQFAQPGTNGFPAAPQPEPAPVVSTAAAPAMFPPPAGISTGTPDIQSILSALQGTAAPQFQPPPPLPTQASLPPIPQVPALPNDLAALMSALQAGAGSGMAIPPPPPGLPPGLPPGFPFSMPFTQPTQQQDATAYQPQQQQQYSQQATVGTKRPRDDSNDRGQGKKHKNRTGEKPHKVLPCRFYQKGTCNKGEHCTYVHDMNM